MVRVTRIWFGYFDRLVYYTGGPFAYVGRLNDLLHGENIPSRVFSEEAFGNIQYQFLVRS